MDNQLITVSSTPHVRSKESTQSVMRDVLIALLPAAAVGVYYFGANAALILVIAVVSAVGFEYLYQKGTKQVVTINDLSAAVTGLLLAMNMPSTAPWWMPIVGSCFAIIIVKQIFGGIGQNFVNPALAARAFLLASYPTAMTNWVTPGVDAVTTATPLAGLKDGSLIPTNQNMMDAFLGNIGGCIGETCALALIAGGIYLIYRQVISWRIPVVYIGTVFVLTYLLGRSTGSFPVYEILTGGVMLGAFFMATDYTTSPMTPVGQIIMALGCGFITTLIRIYGGYPEGVSYSILIMNLCVPLIDRFTKPKVFGEVKKA